MQNTMTGFIHIWNNDKVTWMLGVRKVEFGSVPKYDNYICLGGNLKDFFNNDNYRCFSCEFEIFVS